MLIGFDPHDGKAIYFKKFLRQIPTAQFSSLIKFTFFSRAWQAGNY
jgi:hypothetical protein